MWIIVATISSIGFSQVQDSVSLRGLVMGPQMSKLEGVSVFVNGIYKTRTDHRGFFEVVLTKGMQTLNFYAEGFRQATKLVSASDLGRSPEFFVYLEPLDYALDTIIVTGEKLPHVAGIAPLNLSLQELRNYPKFVESDPLRSMQSIPGVTNAASDFSAQMSVRGGSFDETLIAIDGVPIMNPYHFSGWFSVINDDIVQTSTLYRSNYPVAYSGYLSAALNLVTKKNRANRYQGSASLSFTSLKAFVQGPLGDGNVLLSSRRMWVDQVWGALVNKEAFPYYFYDVYGKYSVWLGSDNYLSASIFFSRDVLNPFSRYGLISASAAHEPSWGNLVAQASWTHAFDETTTAEAIVYSTSATLLADAHGEYEKSSSVIAKHLMIDNFIRETGGKAIVKTSWSGGECTGGVEIRAFDTRYQWNIQWSGYGDPIGMFFPKAESFYDFAQNPYSAAARAITAGGHIQVQENIGERLAFTFGYRMDYLSQAGKAYHLPFVGARYTVHPRISLSLAWGKYYQMFYTLKEHKDEETMFSPYAIYFVGKSQDQIAVSDHITVGLQTPRLVSDIQAEVEAYFKTRKNLASSWKDSVVQYSFENGYAFGVDVLTKKVTGPVGGWLAYSFIRSVKDNGRYKYFSNADRTHSVKAVLWGQMTDWLKVDAFWTASSGVPYTAIIGRYPGLSQWEGISSEPEIQWRPIRGRKNSARSLPYRRLDVGITASFLWGTTVISTHLQVFNITNEPNPFFYSGDGVETGENQRASSIIPSLGLTVEF